MRNSSGHASASTGCRVCQPWPERFLPHVHDRSRLLINLPQEPVVLVNSPSASHSPTHHGTPCRLCRWAGNAPVSARGTTYSRTRSLAYHIPAYMSTQREQDNHLPRHCLHQREHGKGCASRRIRAQDRRTRRLCRSDSIFATGTRSLSYSATTSARDGCPALPWPLQSYDLWGPRKLPCSGLRRGSLRPTFVPARHGLKVNPFPLSPCSSANAHTDSISSDKSRNYTTPACCTASSKNVICF